MPFGAVDRPSLGISLLKASLSEKGYVCNNFYLLEGLLKRIGLEDYQWLTDGVPYTSFVGDWIFTRALYGADYAEIPGDKDRAESSLAKTKELLPALEQDYLRTVLLETWQFSDADIRRVLRIRQHVEPYLQDCVNAVNWHDYDVVGFTSTFTQNIASLALAQRIKLAYPNIKIVFGGANWEGDMGMALHSHFHFVDYACSGEADLSFPALIDELASNNPEIETVGGVVFRDTANGAGSLMAKPSAPVFDLDAFPVPDYSDYFAMLRGSNEFESVSPSLLMETSRGCWWGAKHHCTFCGLNGNGMTFRAKSSERALKELITLVGRWKVPFVSMVDNIIDLSYFNSFLKDLAKQQLDAHLFYETKANLKREQVEAMADAKVTSIQPGIESLSDHVLKLMRKGTSGLRNIQLLKWCKEYGVSVEWNILYGFPGEKPRDYAESFHLLSLVPHLQPPSGSGPIRLDRFSPYYETPEKFGLTNVRAMNVFKYLYPFEPSELQRIACYFEFDYETPPPSNPYLPKLLKLVDSLNARQQRGDLTAIDNGKAIQIYDSRAGYRSASYELKDYDRVIYLLLDEVGSAKKVHRELQSLFNNQRFCYDELQEQLEVLYSARLLAKQNGRYLALAVYRQFPKKWRQNLPFTALPMLTKHSQSTKESTKESNKEPMKESGENLWTQ